MSPTIFRVGKYRAFFFSREESRLHVHISCADGEAKFWIKPLVALADYSGLSARELREIKSLVEEHANEIAQEWHKRFKR